METMELLNKSKATENYEDDQLSIVCPRIILYLFSKPNIGKKSDQVI